jgi:hypothetical protein
MYKWLKGQASGVIARLVRDCALGRATQYSRESSDLRRSRGVLGPPLEPVIGLAEGETRWRRTTAVGWSRSAANRQPFYAFFFTSLTLEKLMPSARSRV